MEEQKHLKITIVSFGYKYMYTPKVNLLFDVRLFSNPYYEDSLRHLSGLDSAVGEFMYSHEGTGEFIERCLDFIKYYIGEMSQADRDVKVAFGCTGGRHRSVFFAHEICTRLKREGFCADELHLTIDR